MIYLLSTPFTVLFSKAINCIVAFPAPFDRSSSSSSSSFIFSSSSSSSSSSFLSISFFFLFSLDL
jgi:hypothetical protein